MYLKKAWQSNNNKKDSSGKHAENVAVNYLRKQKVNIIERNFLCRLGEIDIIGSHNQEIIFFEVRYRSNDSHGSAAQSITKLKQKKIIKTAQYWLTQNKTKQSHAMRFDAILFDQKINYQHLTWLKAVF